MEQLKNIKLQPQECIISYDVKALFTSVPIQPAIKIIKQHLEGDQELQQRTSMTIKHIICLFEFCLKNTYFIFQGRFTHKPHNSKLIYGGIWNTSYQHSTTSPSLWRFVDHTFVVIHEAQKDSFIEHINSIDDKIQFTMIVEVMGPCLFQTLWLHQDQMVVWVPQCTENQPTLICTCSGTAITPLQPNKVW